MARKRVVWDETNLSNNEEYRRLHPVTMRIDEPKTPYVHDEDGSLSALLQEGADDSVVAASDSVKSLESSGTFEKALEEDVEANSTWDPSVNALAHRLKVSAPYAPANVAPTAPTQQTVTACADDRALSSSAAAADCAKKTAKRARPNVGPISTDVVEDKQVQEREVQQAEETFKRMRKAVYADEGAKFRANLLKAQQEAEEEEDDEG